VLVENWEPETGWFEAVVLEQVADDEFKLRFRDYPEVRRRNQLALLSPGAQHFGDANCRQTLATFRER
jgi:hypothetical protein